MVTVVVYRSQATQSFRLPRGLLLSLGVVLINSSQIVVCLINLRFGSIPLAIALFYDYQTSDYYWKELTQIIFDVRI